MAPFTLECIRWRDAHDGDYNWLSLDDLRADDEEAIVTTVGWILPCKKPRYLAVAHSVLDYFDSFTGIIFIPEENIISRVIIPVPEGGFSNKEPVA